MQLENLIMNILPLLKKAPYILETLPESLYVAVFKFCDGERDIGLCSVFHQDQVPTSQVSFTKNSSYAKLGLGGYAIEGIVKADEIIKSLNINEIQWKPLPVKATKEMCLGMAVTLCKDLRGIPTPYVGLLVYRQQQDQRIHLEKICSQDGSPIAEDIELYGNLYMQPQGYIPLVF